MFCQMLVGSAGFADVSAAATVSAEMFTAGTTGSAPPVNEDDEEVDLLLFDSSIPKSVEKVIQKRAVELANFIRANLGEVRLQGSDYGPHQMTGIHDLKEFWGKGAQVDVRV